MRKDIIQLAQQSLLNQEDGHLPLTVRVDLLKELNDKNKINKIFLACALKVYPFWENAFPTDATVYDLLSKADDYLYRDIKVDFVSFANSYKGYLERITVPQASAAGLSALALCYSIGYSNAGVVDEDYQGEDDNDFDWETWWPDFFASVAFAGGNPFLGEGNSALRSQFWSWYLQCVQETDLFPEKHFLPLPPLPASTLGSSSFIRSQTSDTTDIRTKIEAVIAATKQDLTKQYPTTTWTRLSIEVVCMASGVSLKANFATSAQPDVQPIKLSYYLQSGDRSSAHLMGVVKRSMYEQAPREGAWMQCHILVQSSDDWTIDFNYDEIEKLPESKTSPDYLLLEFQKFPRSEQFTPSWWKAIIQNKAPYYK